MPHGIYRYVLLPALPYNSNKKNIADPIMPSRFANHLEHSDFEKRKEDRTKMKIPSETKPPVNTF